jgi:signal transduction histidine kinase
VVVAVTIILEGLASTRIGYASFDDRFAVMALLTGWLVTGCGLVAWVRTRASRTGPLLVLLGATWFIGGFRWLAVDPVAELASALDLVWLGVAGHAVLTFPTGRFRSSALSAIIVTGYAATLVPAPRADVLAALVMLAGIVVALIREQGGGRDRRRVLIFGAGLALVVAGYRVVPAWIGGLAWLDSRPLVLVALVAVAVILALPLTRPRPTAGRIADLVIELGASPRTDLMRDLGELVGDPAAKLGLWYPDGQRYVDALGRPIELPPPGDPRSATFVDDDGERLAVLVHTATTRPDPVVTSAVRSAAHMSLAHARLQADVRDQVLAVRVSRRRLLVAGDEERTRLGAQLRDRLDPRIDALESNLGAAELRGDTAASDALEHLRQIRIELDGFISGIGPPGLDERGLDGALHGLAATTRVPLELRLDAAEIPSRITRSALVFVAREALANIDKHAKATKAAVHLSHRDGVVHLHVSDDGQGGADVGRGTGLQGLRDRVEALGGQLSLTSAAGRGTILSASLPMEDAVW